MQSKLLEVRDRATLIPIMATKMDSEIEEERRLLGYSGYVYSPIMVMVTLLNGGKSEYDPFKWGTNPRTLFEAHRYIRDNFDNLESGDVVCVEYILGERNSPKLTDMNFCQ